MSAGSPGPWSSLSSVDPTGSRSTSERPQRGRPPAVCGRPGCRWRPPAPSSRAPRGNVRRTAVRRGRSSRVAPRWQVAGPPSRAATGRGAASPGGADSPSLSGHSRRWWVWTPNLPRTKIRLFGDRYPIVRPARYADRRSPSPSRRKGQTRHRRRSTHGAPGFRTGVLIVARAAWRSRSRAVRRGSVWTGAGKRPPSLAGHVRSRPSRCPRHSRPTTSPISTSTPSSACSTASAGSTSWSTRQPDTASTRSRSRITARSTARSRSTRRPRAREHQADHRRRDLRRAALDARQGRQGGFAALPPDPAREGTGRATSTCAGWSPTRTSTATTTSPASTASISRRYSEGLIGLSACLNGEVARALETEDWDLRAPARRRVRRHLRPRRLLPRAAGPRTARAAAPERAAAPPRPRGRAAARRHQRPPLRASSRSTRRTTCCSASAPATISTRPGG